MVSCILYYVVLFADTFKVDQLTGLLNRRSLYNFVTRNKNRKFSVISADLNCLKDINDTGGHRAGDDALKFLASVLLNAGGRKFHPYRVGGDEFVVIGKELQEAKIMEYINEVKLN